MSAALTPCGAAENTALRGCCASWLRTSSSLKKRRSPSTAARCGKAFATGSPGCESDMTPAISKFG
jgi:hypothetical protein